MILPHLPSPERQRRLALRDSAFKGIAASHRITTYVDTLMSCTNPTSPDDRVSGVPTPHPCAVDPTLFWDNPEAAKEHFAQLLGCIQRRICV